MTKVPMLHMPVGSLGVDDVLRFLVSCPHCGGAVHYRAAVNGMHCECALEALGEERYIEEFERRYGKSWRKSLGGTS